jgi:hypothetical protein
VAGIQHGYFLGKRVRRRSSNPIANAKPDLLFVALSTPFQDGWIHKNLSRASARRSLWGWGEVLMFFPAVSAAPQNGCAPPVSNGSFVSFKNPAEPPACYDSPFQGIERMGYVMYINLFSKTFFTLLIFLTIHQPEDYRMYAIVNSAGYLLTGIFSLVVALKIGSFSFIRPSRQTMMGMLRKTRDVFVSNVGGSLYMTSTPFLLGIMTGRNDLVGYYTVAEKNGQRDPIFHHASDPGFVPLSEQTVFGGKPPRFNSCIGQIA